MGSYYANVILLEIVRKYTEECHERLSNSDIVYIIT